MWGVMGASRTYRTCMNDVSSRSLPGRAAFLTRYLASRSCKGVCWRKPDDRCAQNVPAHSAYRDASQ